MLYLLLALILYTAALTFGVIAARNANATVLAAVQNFISGFIPILLALPLVLSKKVPIVNQKFGLLMGVCGGICIAIFTIIVNKAYTENKIAIVNPVIFGGAILITAIIGYFFMKEKIGPIQGVGLALLAFGIILIIYARATGENA